MHQAGEKALAAVQARSPSRVDSPYLRMLLDPAAFGPGHYPDNFGGKVALGKFRISKTVKCDSNGNFTVWANPCLTNAVAYPQQQGAAQRGYIFQNQFLQDNSNPLYPRCKIPPAANWEYVPLVEGPSYTDGNGVEHKLSVKGPDKILLPPGYIATTSLTILAGGTEAWAGTTLAFQLRYSDTTVAAVTLGTPVVIAPGFEWVQIQVSRSAGAAKDYLKTIQFSLLVNEIANNGDLAFEDVPDYDLLAGNNQNDVEAGETYATTYSTPLYMEYRPVAMCLLVSFVGNTLYDGGTIAGKALMGGESPQRLDFPTYEELSQVPGAFNGPLKTGFYGWWKPTDADDIKFREPDYDNVDGAMPSLYVAGKATDPANTQIRLDYCLCVEAKTTRQILPTTYSRVDPDEITAADRALQGMAQCMENPLHLGKIADFLRGVVRRGEEFWAKYQRPIMATAGAVKTIAPMFLAAA
nr:hypothetical protein [Sobelivirales sp.]